MKKIFPYILGAIISLAVCSCTKDSDKNTYANQEETIESFVNSQLESVDSSYVVSNKGSQRVVVARGSGDQLSSGGVVSFYYAGYVLNGSSVSPSNLFATNRSDIAEQSSWNLSDEHALDILTISLGDTDLVEGLKNGLIGVQGGEESYILFSGKHGFGKRPLGTIPAKSALVYHIWVESISND